MLLDFFPSLKDSKVILFLQKFLYSKLYIALVGLLTFLCHTFALEIPYYYFIVTICLVIPALFCEDLLPVVAPLSMTYSTVSIKSNDSSKGVSLFSGSSKIHLLILVIIIGVFVVGRLIYDLITKRERRRKPSLFFGFVAVLPFFLFGGLFSGLWKMNTFLYGLVVFLSLSGCYFLLLYLVDWKKAPKDYFMWVMLVYGLSISSEVIFMIISSKAGGTNFYKTDSMILYTGWGMRNNIAGQIAMCVTAPLYLSCKSKKLDWLFLLAIPVMAIGSLLTNSRGGTLTSAIVFIAGFVIYLVVADKRHKIVCASLVVGISGLLVGFFFLFKDPVKITLFRFFDGLNTRTLKTRYEGWIEGLTLFTKHPVLGSGFYCFDGYKFDNFSTGFVPPRYHNTIIQLLASTGVLGLLAYGFHRFETIRITFKKPTLEKNFIFLAICALLVQSLLDNGVFNLGPGLNYCVALACIEGINIQNGVEIKWFKKKNKKIA